MTMSPEKPKDSWNHNIVKFDSLAHVHPKLPDHAKKLAAKFMALKKPNFQTKHN